MAQDDHTILRKNRQIASATCTFRRNICALTARLFRSARFLAPKPSRQ